jgi:hypothetical protein
VDKSYAKGLQYELVAKAIFQEILEESGGLTLRVEHLATVQGLKTRWKIDVLWEFQLGGIPYLTLVQVKNWESKVSQEHVGAFEAVLRDIPGQPRGVMVSRCGFQEGATSLAKAAGILLYQLSPLPQVPTVLYDYGWASMKMNLQTLQMETTVFNPRVALTFNLPSGTNTPLDSCLKSMVVREYLLSDERGGSLGTMRDVVAELVGEIRAREEPSGTRVRVFKEPTFIRHEQSDHQVPVLSVTAEITITPEARPDRPLLPRGFVMFVLTNLQTGKSSTHAVNSQPRIIP